MRRPSLSGLALLGIVALLMSFALPMTASAAKPGTNVFTLNDTVVDDFLSDACGFPVESHVEGTVRTIFWDDPAGSALYKQIEVYPALVRTFTNLDSGESITSRNPSVVTITVNADESLIIEVTGLTFAFHVPGEGLVYLNTGRVTIFFDGPDDMEPDVTQTPPAGDFVAALCSVLG